MAHPKISPILNNCPFYALTPEIKAEVIKYAGNDAYDNRHNEEYILLLQHFSAYYNIAPLSWKDFAAILNNYNAHDTQIILGPVLRNYLTGMMEKDKENLANEAIIDGLNSAEEFIQAVAGADATGRYYSLDPQQLFKYVAAPLGLSLTCSKNGKVQRSYDAPNPVIPTAVPMHHHGGIQGAQAGGHWERVEKPIEEAEDAQNDDDAQLAPLLLLLGDTASKSALGIRLLKEHVQLIHHHEKDNADITAAVREIMLTSAQVEKYMQCRLCLDHDLAMQVLGQVTTTAEQCIESLDIDPIINENIVNYLKGKTLELNEDESVYLASLLQDIIVPRYFIPPVKEAIQPILAGIEPVEAHKSPKREREGLKHSLPSVELLEPIELIEEEHSIDHEKHKEEPSPVPVQRITAIEENPKEKARDKREGEQLVDAAVKPHPKRHKPQESANRATIVHEEPVIEQHAPQAKQKESPIKGAVEQSKPSVELQAPKVNSKHKKAPIKKAVVHHNMPVVEHQPPQIEAVKAEVKPPVKHTVVKHRAPVIQEQTAHVPAKREVVSEPVATQQIEQTRQLESIPAGALELSPGVILPVAQPTSVKSSPIESQPKPEKQVFPEITKKAEFNKRIDALKEQVDNLKERMEIEAKRNTSSEDYQKLKAAYDATANIHRVIKDAGNEYFERKMSYVEFKGLVKDTVNNEETRPILEQHRGIKKVLEDIINFLPKLINSIFGTKMTLFKLNTESVNKIDAVADNVNKAGPGAN